MILRCATCGLPFAHVDRGRLFVVSMHHGGHHTSTVTLEELARALAGGPEPAVQSVPYRVKPGTSEALQP